jgi:DNA-binding transcriptional MocR family regulator
MNDGPTWRPRLKEDGTPVYLSIAEALEADIKASVLKAGDRLPPQRDLADFLQVNLTTVTKAFKICERKGLIGATVGRGTFVASDSGCAEPSAPPEGEAHGGLIELGTLHPFCAQSGLVAESIGRLAQNNRLGSYLEYDEPKWGKSHCETGVEWLARFNIHAKADDIVIASGAQNALAVTLLSLFQAGDKIGADSLTYMGFKNLAAFFGIRLIPVGAEENCMSAEALERACAAEGLKGLYIMPECHNPTTATMPLPLRQKIAQVVRKNRLVLIEDDTYSFLENTALPPVSGLVPGQSVAIASTSKSLGPGLRVAFMAVAPQFRNRIDRGIYSVNLNTSHFNVEIAADLVETGMADRILTEKRQEAEARNGIVDELLEGFTVQGNRRDYFRWLVLPSGWTGKEFELCAKVSGVQLFCAERFAVGSSPVPAAVRIATASARSRRELMQGLTIVKSLLEKKPDASALAI